MEPVENNNGPQTTTVYGSIQTRSVEGAGMGDKSKGTSHGKYPIFN